MDNNEVSSYVLNDSESTYDQSLRIIEQLQTMIPFLTSAHEQRLQELVESVRIIDSSSISPFRQLLPPHSLCKGSGSQQFGMQTRRNRQKNGVLQKDLKYLLMQQEDNIEAHIFFQETVCYVCAKSFKEIIEGDYHFLLPTCGHVICCQCAVKVLSCKPECCMCKSKWTSESFEMLKFNAKLLPDSENKRYFL